MQEIKKTVEKMIHTLKLFNMNIKGWSQTAWFEKVKNDRGMTLVELIVVMIIVGLLIAVAIPNFSAWRKNYQIRAESERVYMDLILARSTAIKNNNDVIVTFNEANDSYTILDDTNNNGSADSGESLKTVSLENLVEFGFYGSSIQDMENNTVNQSVSMGPSDIVVFNEKGQANISGSLYLIHKDDASTTNDQLRGISVVQGTGAAELWKYNSSMSPIPWE